VKVNVDKTGTVEGLQKVIQETTAYESVQSLLIMACDANEFTPETVDEILAGVSVPVIGGIFPEIIHGREKLTQGTIAAGLSRPMDAQIIPGLSDTAVDYSQIIDKKFPDIGQAKTMFVFVDGLTSRIGDLIDSLFEIFGLEINYVGGGAGSLSFQQKPCLFTNQGLIQDSAVLGLIEMSSGVGVSHGWQSISGPYKMTGVERNVIKTLDWKPAFAVYRQIVEEASGQTFTDDNFFDIAKGYPFGINRAGAEKIVRDPIATDENGTLICVGEVPADGYVDILSGNKESLVHAAETAFADGRAAYDGAAGEQCALFIDCISRVLFLEDEFTAELDAVYDENIPLIGALTLGEIANCGDDYLEFYNKTAVVAVLDNQ